MDSQFIAHVPHVHNKCGEVQCADSSVFDFMYKTFFFILGKWPTWCTNSFLCIYFYL